MKKIIQITIAVVFMIIFLSLLYLVLTKKIENMDYNIYQRISKIINPTNTAWMKTITFFGSLFGIICGIAISCFFLKKNFDRGFLCLTMLGEVIINNVIKILIKRPRPSINPLVTETSYSFPSGHTMAVTAFYALVLFFLWKSPLSLIWKIIITLISSIIILTVAFSRVYLGVHYTSDVLAGVSCSLAYVLLITLCYTNLKELFI